MKARRPLPSAIDTLADIRESVARGKADVEVGRIGTVTNFPKPSPGSFDT